MIGGLGRIVEKDPKDQNFLAKSILPPKEPLPDIKLKYWWDNGAWLDQGFTGTCVGHGWAHWLEDSPITHPKVAINPFDIYLGACANDSWPENDDGDLNFGTSVRAGAKYLQDKGFIGEYRWAWDVDTVIRTLLTFGGCVIGVDWYRGSSEPSYLTHADGVSRVTLTTDGPLDGGHCVTLNGVNRNAGIVRVKNSWGREWAASGRAVMSFDTLAQLLAEDGEMCIATEVRRG